MASTRKIKFLVISDTHDLELGDDPSVPFRNPAPEADVVLHCGDLTENGGVRSYATALEMLSSIKAELKLVIAGNHEIDLDAKYWQSPQATGAGVTFLEEGTHHFRLSNGASFSIYASPWTPQFGESAFQYPTNEDRYNPPNSVLPWASGVGTTASVIPDGVDIVMTHGPPKYVLDKIRDGRSGGCEHLRRAICRTKPLLHCFGHVHTGYGAQRVAWKGAVDVDELVLDPQAISKDDDMVALPAEYVGRNQARKKGYAAINPRSAQAIVKGEQTLMVNAAIMGDGGVPANAPWMVELVLPSSSGKRGREEDSEEGEETGTNKKCCYSMRK